jgi:hypothetical protein
MVLLWSIISIIQPQMKVGTLAKMSNQKAFYVNVQVTIGSYINGMKIAVLLAVNYTKKMRDCAHLWHFR